jgi:hypothetical protein
MINCRFVCLLTLLAGLLFAFLSPPNSTGKNREIWEPPAGIRTQLRTNRLFGAVSIARRPLWTVSDRNGSRRVLSGPTPVMLRMEL